MGSLLGLAGTLIAGGKVLGLTLAEWEAAAGVVQTVEPEAQAVINALAPLLQKVAPDMVKQFRAALADVGKPPVGIPGYGSDGGVGTITNPDK